jgi:hypothetical protein
MRIMCLTLSIMMIAGASHNLSFGHSVGQGRRKLIKVKKMWAGEIKLELLQQAPPNDFILDEDAWAKLWKAYCGDDELPKIDFDKQMILVKAGPNPTAIHYDPQRLILNEQGDLSVQYYTSWNRYPDPNPKSGRYIFLQISREGVKSINGITIE